MGVHTTPILASPSVLINIGGEVVMEVQRATFQTFEGTHIADMFKDDSESKSKLHRDGHGRIMIDCTASVFVPLVNLLRSCRLAQSRGSGGFSVPLPCFQDRKLNEDFRKALLEYGLAQFVRNDSLCGGALEPGQNAVRQDEEKLQEGRPISSTNGRMRKAVSSIGPKAKMY
jgi:hypothetical protein